MTIDTERAAIDGVDGYPSLAALREAHGTILEQRRLHGEMPALSFAVEQFIRRGTATGALLDDSEERRAAQNLLNYWANALYRAGREPLDATLADFDPLLAPELPDALCPYLGLDAFSETSANRFFGRQELIARLLDRLRDQRFLAVVGPSGSGKSSVVRAGLLPALRAGALPGSESWQYIPPLVPGSDPLESLAGALRLLTTAGQPHNDGEPVAPPAKSTRPAGGVAPLASEALLHSLLFPTEERPASSDQPPGNGGSGAPAVAPAHQTDAASLAPDTLRLRQDAGMLAQRLAAAGTPAVLVVDQFEEVFTLCEDIPTRQAFVANLLALASTPEMPHRVILTMRSDFETFIARVPELLSLFEGGRVQATPLSATDLREAIEAPAAQAGLKFEQGVVDLLLQDILGEPAGLPLLQFTLLKLWEQRERNRVTRAAYDRVGGGRLALARSADAFYQSLIPEEQVTARRVLLRMVRPGEGLEITSSRVRRATLVQGGEDPGRVERVLRKLIDARLVRLTAGETPQDDQVEVAHEALVRNWPTLVEWLEEEKVALATRRRLEQRTAEWLRLGQSDAGLLDEVEWREAERWLRSTDAQNIGYDPALPALIAASREATERVEREKEAARRHELEQARALAEAQRLLAESQARTARRLRWAAIALLALLAVALIAAGYAVVQRRTVDIQRLALEARLQFDSKPETALLLAYEAASRADNTITEQTLRDAIDRSPSGVISLREQGGAIKGTQFSPDDQHMLTWSEDGTAQLWDLSGQQLAVLQHTDSIWGAMFSPDGRRILTWAGDGKARLWDLSGQQLAVLQHTKKINGASFSPDGQRILSWSKDGTARLWNLRGQPLAVLQHTKEINGASFSPDGQRILSWSKDGTARLWEAGGTLLMTFLHAGPDDKASPVNTASFSPNDQRILTDAEDGSARLWDLGGHQLAQLAGPGGPVWGAVFSPDGQRILTRYADGTARLWNLSGKLLAILEGHTGQANSAVFSADGQHALTASGDGTARLWDAASGNLLVVFRGHNGPVWDAMFIADNQRVLTRSEDGTARLWDLNGRLLAILQHIHIGPISNMASSHDGRHILTSSDDGVVRLWDVGDKQLVSLQSRTGPVRSAVFSPDGQRILATSEDHTARLWDAASGRLLMVFRGHLGPIESVVFSPDGQRVLTASDDRTARLWDAASGKELLIFRGHEEVLWSAVFSPDGQRVLTASSDGTARLWDAASGKELLVFQGHTDLVRGAVFSPDGQRVLTASKDHTARLWDAASGKELLQLQHDTSRRLRSVAFSRDGRQFLTGAENGTVQLWDASGKKVTVIRGHAGAILSVTFSRDGRRILTSSDDGTARLWDLSGQQLAVFEGHIGPVTSAVFSPDEQRILTASNDGTVRRHLVRAEDLLAIAACRVGRGLTAEEIQLFDVGTPRFNFAKRQCPPALGGT